MFNSGQITHYLHNTHYSNVEFINSKNERLHVFKCRNGDIVYGEIGDGYIYDFNIEDFKNDEWILSLNPHIR